MPVTTGKNAHNAVHFFAPCFNTWKLLCGLFLIKCWKIWFTSIINPGHVLRKGKFSLTLRRADVIVGTIAFQSIRCPICHPLILWTANVNRKKCKYIALVLIAKYACIIVTQHWTIHNQLFTFNETPYQANMSPYKAIYITYGLSLVHCQTHHMRTPKTYSLD